MTLCENPLSRSLSGVKQTWALALHMSAFDPKRTWRLQSGILLMTQSRCKSTHQKQGYAACWVRKSASAFFPSLAACAIVSKNTVERITGSDLPAR